MEPVNITNCPEAPLTEPVIVLEEIFEAVKTVNCPDDPLTEPVKVAVLMFVADILVPVTAFELTLVNPVMLVKPLVILPVRFNTGSVEVPEAERFVPAVTDVTVPTPTDIEPLAPRAIVVPFVLYRSLMSNFLCSINKSSNL